MSHQSMGATLTDPMDAVFSPEFLVVAREIGLFFTTCPNAILVIALA